MPDETKSSKAWNFDRWLSVISFAITVVTLIYAKEEMDGLKGTLHTYWPIVVAALLAVGIVVAIYRTISLHSTKNLLHDEQQKSRRLEADNKRLESERSDAIKTRDEAVVERDLMKKDYIPYQKDTKVRWSQITTIRYGHLEYEPFLNYQFETPTGLGVDLLTRLLDSSEGGKKIQILADTQIRNWDDILTGLVEKNYDVVATPLFATFDRSKLVRFTAPLFFSNIGLYVNKEIASMSFWKDATPETLREDIKSHLLLTFFAVKGEISAYLANKYVAGTSIRSYEGKVVPGNLFNEIANTKQANALFCESFYAHHQPRVRSGEVVNVLPWHQILYPVCFAVRQGDYNLANLLNIRLLQMTQNDGALDLLAKKLGDDPRYCPYVDELKLHFVAEWPSPGQIKDHTHA